MLIKTPQTLNKNRAKAKTLSQPLAGSQNINCCYLFPRFSWFDKIGQFGLKHFELCEADFCQQEEIILI